MPSKSGEKGKRWERAVVNYLKEQGFTNVYRTKAGRFDDVGDIGGFFGFVVQCKDYANVTRAVAEGVDSANEQRHVAGAPFGFAIVKRPRRATSEAYVVMDLEQFVEFVSATT